MNPPVPSFDFVRSLCSLGIVVYHFSCHIKDKSFLPLYSFLNGDWGTVLVTVFFMLSGASLYYRYSDKLHTRSSVGLYFYKRWLSIFPMYYLAYISFEVITMIRKQNIFFRGNPLKYVFTFFGMDGYLSSVLPTAYNIGEWFTGAIIILYILFPLLLHLFQRKPVLTTLAVIALYILTLDIPIINPTPFWSIPSCMLSFVCGMVFMKNRQLFEKAAGQLLIILGCIIIFTVKLPFCSNINWHLAGILIFLLLYILGRLVMTNPVACFPFTQISRISYALFLVHHKLIYVVLRFVNPVGRFQVLAVVFSSILVFLFIAKGLMLISNIVTSLIDPWLRKKLFPA